MASRPVDLKLRIIADDSQLAPGLASLTKGLDKVEKSAANTNAALAKVGQQPVTLTVRDQAVINAKKRIDELRDEIARAKMVDVRADTSAAEREIRRLQASIKSLTPPKIGVDADTAPAATKLGRLAGALEAAKGKAGELQGALAGIGSGGGMGGLSSLMGILGRGGGLAVGIGAAAVAAVKMDIALGHMAADAETAEVAWKGILQNAEQAAAMTGRLREFSAATPFNFEQVDKAAKGLVAYGVAADDVESTLTNLGNAAAAVSAPLDQVSRAFGQMTGKGKISAQDMLQLTEAGIPGWRLLADSMGLTVEQVQKLSEEGKLGADAVTLLGHALGTTFKGSMTDQARTFNGMMSNLQDNVQQTGQNLGSVFLPIMKDVVAILATGAQQAAYFTKAIAGLMQNTTAQAMFMESMLGPLAPLLDGVAKGVEAMNGSTDDAALSQEQLAAEGEKVRASLDLGRKSYEEFNKVVEDAAKDKLAGLNTALQTATRNVQSFFAELGQDTANADAFERSLLALRDSIKDNGRAFEGNSEKALNNRDALRDVAGRAGELVGAMTEAGASGEEAGAKMAALRTEFINTAVAMGVPTKQAEELADKYGLIPKDVKTKVEGEGVASLQSQIKDLQDRLDKLDGKTATVGVRVNYEGKYKAMDQAQAQALGANVQGRSFNVPPPPGPAPAPSSRMARTASTFGLAAAPLTAAGVPTFSPTVTVTPNITVNLDGNPVRGIVRDVVTSELGRQVRYAAAGVRR